MVHGTKYHWRDAGRLLQIVVMRSLSYLLSYEILLDHRINRTSIRLRFNFWRCSDA